MSGCRIAEQVRWAVEAAGVVLIHGATGETILVGYPRAAIWDFLTRGEDCERMAVKLCAIASLQPAAARMLVQETVAEWREAELLCG
ncbi:MAG: hypothetical protein ACLQGV_15740 [Bryobacteraceae bacterium]